VKRFALVVLAIAAGGTGYLAWHASDAAGENAPYRFAAVERGAIAQAVTATGVVTAVATVHVGATLSGQVIAVHGDFNGDVKRDQLLARLDPEPYEYRLKQARADLEAAKRALVAAQNGVAAARAEIARARVAGVDALHELDRSKQLAERGFISTTEADRAEAARQQSVEAVKAGEVQITAQESQVEAARAVVRSREAQLAQARADLERTFVRAPLDGTIISRNVETGQVVGTGAQAPALFVIARDLREMHVEAVIDEADVGRLRVGQSATFTVEAFPRRTFEGVVAQIRKAPHVGQTGVGYVAVIAAPNADLALLPGMTATVRVNADPRTDVLKVPTAALRFRPPGMHAGAGTRLWLPDAAGGVRPLDVRTGISDESYTEIQGSGLAPGATVIVGLAPAPAGAARAATPTDP
jgi:HlyD family secretion protein